MMESSDVLDELELAEPLRKLLDRVEHVTAKLWELEEPGYQVNWRCCAETLNVDRHRIVEHDIELDRDTLQKLLTFPGDLWLDVWEEAQ
jgi:hypothetical protein